MKYIKGYLLLGLTLILGSCSDFLDRDPDQILTNDQIFSDAKMINSVLAGFYGDTENWGQSFATPASFTKVDDGCVTDGARDNMQEYSDNQWRVYPYKYIRNLNQFLAGLRATTVLESTEKLRYEGEIRFLRAWAYFSMCRGLGGVPIVNDNVYEYEAGMDVSGLAVPRSKESEVYDYIINEKQKTATLTKRGVKKAEQFFSLENLTDPDNITIQHHINQAIKANGIMQRDIDYVVRDGEVIIVDEFTGRLMYGRRYNEGLHQAIEAKEGVKIARESKTLATITFQNFFRLYNKLSGMTGTAMTEESEFSEIYKLDVVEIPTNKPMIREDCPDVVYKTEKGKFNAVINDIIEHHEKGQPVLVGTITIEKSEQLSAMLKRRGIKHEVLNAKYHEKEAEIVAQAGRKGAVTIATNMAGRGTDILLGGNAEFMARAEMRRMQFSEELIGEASAYGYTDDEEILNARKTFAELNKKYKAEIAPEAEEVRKLGGLYIIGTERHESRRIDNQLRGRAGRQGDPGKSRFYISLEDDLMRLFGGDRIQTIMDRLNVDEDMPIEASILSNTIENAQKKVEGRNFAIRKNVLQYDDVMNRQREIIYEQRDRVLNGDNVKPQIMSMIDQAIEANVKRFLPENTLHDDWDLRGLRDHYLGWMVNPDELHYEGQAFEDLEQQTVIDFLKERAHKLYDLREKAFTPPIMREVERVVLLKNVDTQWMDHIDAMDELQKGIRLRAYGQQDPVIAYREEGFDMFDAMIDTIRENTARMILTVRLKTPEAPKREAVAKETGTTSSDTPAVKQPVRKNGKKPGRNDPCPCGSGKKYKKCCGRNES